MMKIKRSLIALLFGAVTFFSSSLYSQQPKNAVSTPAPSLFEGVTVPWIKKADPPLPENWYDDQHWSVLYYYGWTAKEVVGRLLAFNFTSANEIVQSFEVSYLPEADNPFRAFFNPLVDVIEIALNYSHRSSNMDQHSIYEFDPYIAFRWINFPWKNTLPTTIAIGEGVSYASFPPAIERENSDGDYKRFLNYLMFEITLSPPTHRNFQLVGRLHHRSGGYGLYGAGNSGSNTIGLGIRYRF